MWVDLISSTLWRHLGAREPPMTRTARTDPVADGDASYKVRARSRMPSQIRLQLPTALTVRFASSG